VVYAGSNDNRVLALFGSEQVYALKGPPT